MIQAESPQHNHLIVPKEDDGGHPLPKHEERSNSSPA